MSKGVTLSRTLNLTPSLHYSRMQVAISHRLIFQWLLNFPISSLPFLSYRVEYLLVALNFQAPAQITTLANQCLKDKKSALSAEL